MTYLFNENISITEPSGEYISEHNTTSFNDTTFSFSSLLPKYLMKTVNKGGKKKEPSNNIDGLNMVKISYFVIEKRSHVGVSEIESPQWLNSCTVSSLQT